METNTIGELLLLETISGTEFQSRRVFIYSANTVHIKGLGQHFKIFHK